MPLHMPTFHVVFASIAAVAVLALATEWRRSGQRAIVYWTAAYAVICAMEMVNLLADGSDVWRAAGSPAMRMVAFSLMAVGSLVFVGRRLSLLPFLFPLSWLMLWAWRWSLAPLAQSGTERQILAAVGLAILCAVTAVLFHRGSEESHHERCLSVAFALHAAITASRILLFGSISLPAGTPAGDTVFTLFLVEAIIFVSATSYLFVGAAKERTVGRWKAAAQIDGLTGALSRRAILDTAADRRRSPRPATFAILDLDHFKSINDRFGHATGDEVLRIFVRTLAGCLGKEGVIGRIGGEEFVVVLDADLPEASKRLARALDLFSRSAETLLRLDSFVTASAGLVEDDRASDLETLLARADAALYAAKRDGRNRIEYAPVHPVAGRVPPSESPLATLAIR